MPKITDAEFTVVSEPVPSIVSDWPSPRRRRIPVLFWPWLLWRLWGLFVVVSAVALILYGYFGPRAKYDPSTAPPLPVKPLVGPQ
jgi:hypothetical protein